MSENSNVSLVVPNKKEEVSKMNRHERRKLAVFERREPQIEKAIKLRNQKEKEFLDRQLSVKHMVDINKEKSFNRKLNKKNA
ncbi:MAG: hypothetical protein WCX46_02355 [Candidatus Paceibacterota bacterium]|jgi:hypothetical protein